MNGNGGKRVLNEFPEDFVLLRVGEVAELEGVVEEQFDLGFWFVGLASEDRVTHGIRINGPDHVTPVGTGSEDFGIIVDRISRK